MTNKEKYKEVFGVDPDTNICPTLICNNCPVYDPNVLCRAEYCNVWWNSEYSVKSRKTTNREKYREVFGFYPDCSEKRSLDNIWWYDEYERGN